MYNHLVIWAKTMFSDVFVSWVHIKVPPLPFEPPPLNFLPTLALISSFCGLPGLAAHLALPLHALMKFGLAGDANVCGSCPPIRSAGGLPVLSIAAEGPTGQKTPNSVGGIRLSLPVCGIFYTLLAVLLPFPPSFLSLPRQEQADSGVAALDTSTHQTNTVSQELYQHLGNSELTKMVHVATHFRSSLSTSYARVHSKPQHSRCFLSTQIRFPLIITIRFWLQSGDDSDALNQYGEFFPYVSLDFDLRLDK